MPGDRTILLFAHVEKCIWYCRCSAATAFAGVWFDLSVKGWGNSAGVGIKVMIIPRWSTLLSLFPYTFSAGPWIGFVWYCGPTRWFVWFCMLIFGGVFFFSMTFNLRAENDNWVDLWWPSIRMTDIYSSALSRVMTWSQYLSSQGQIVFSTVDHKAIY